MSEWVYERVGTACALMWCAVPEREAAVVSDLVISFIALPKYSLWFSAISFSTRPIKYFFMLVPRSAAMSFTFFASVGST